MENVPAPGTKLAAGSLRRTVWLRSRASCPEEPCHASNGASSAARVSTVAIMPAEMRPAKRRSDRRREDVGARELSDRNMKECFFTDSVGSVPGGHEPVGPCWTFVG